MLGYYECYFSGADLRAYKQARDHRKAIVTFDHWRRHRTGFPAIKSGANFLQRGYDFFRIDTSKNDWFLNDELEGVLRSTVRQLVRYDHILYLGFSMGCFGALLLSSRLPPNSLIAVSPSYPPGRREDSEEYILPTNSEINGIVQFDCRNSTDVLAAKRFSLHLGGAKMIELEGGGHPATDLIVSRRKYHKLLDHWLSPDIDTSAIRQLHS